LEVLQKTEITEMLSKNALEKVRQYTWDKRAQNILAVIQKYD